MSIAKPNPIDRFLEVLKVGKKGPPKQVAVRIGPNCTLIMKMTYVFDIET